jgi:endonuclease YncB( thermonuclease family)
MPNACLPFTPETRRAAARKLLRSSDGDTPVIEQPIRAVSCDTPEKGGYAGNPPISQPKLDRCRDRLCAGFFPGMPVELAGYLANKITADAAERHIEAAVRASEEFDRLLETRLTKPDGTKRRLAIIPTGQIIDDYSRMLAYFAPWLDKPLPPVGDPARATFNLNMIEGGWAAFFPIYPSLPGPVDMRLAADAAQEAWDQRRGVWAAFGRDLLLGYEYRMCIKLAGQDTGANLMAKAFQRICVDLRTCQELGELDFWRIDPPYRLWVWKEDIQAARVELGLHA